jgi:membrane protein DedA with SNARE-associated domain
VEPIALAGLAALLLVKEAGVPIPVPGDLLVIGAGVALSGDPPLALVALVLILVVGYVGGSVQFLLVRRVLRRALLAVLAFAGVRQERVDALAERLRRSGAGGVAVARMTPGVRIAAIAAAGLAAMPYPVFLAGLVAGNGVFVAGHFGLGYLLGASVGELIQGGIGVIAVAAAGLALLGGVGWIVLRRRRPAFSELAAPYGDWADAACPACLAVASIRGDQSVRDRHVRP